ncbi:bacterial extracellular solute-binding s, 3 family protein, partial [Vibrio harveyi]
SELFWFVWPTRNRSY